MTTWELDDSYSDALSDGVAAQAMAGRSVRGNWWATQTVEVYRNRGSDRFRRNLTGVHNTTMIMKRLKLLNDEQLVPLSIILAASQVIFGGLLIHAGLVNLYRSYAMYQIALATAETTQKAATGPPGWLQIVFAAAMTALVIGTAKIGFEIGKEYSTQNISVKADYRTTSGRQAITSTIRTSTPGA